MHIQKCTLNDIHTLQQISIETFYDTFHAQNSAKNMDDYLATAFTVAQLEKQLQHPHSSFYFLSIDDEVAGYLKLNELDAQTEPLGQHALEVERIYVKTAFQKRGFGKVLLQTAIDVANSRQKETIWLGVWEKNDNAIAFYEKMGFQQTGEHTFQFGDELQTDYVMVKQL